MRPGTVFFDNIYQFEEGKQVRELLVILTDGTKHPYIAVKTTSHPSKYRGNHAGCQVKDELPNFFLPLHSTYLKEDTWIRLDHFENIDSHILNTNIESGELDQVCKLPLKIMHHLLVCSVSSKIATDEQKQVLWNTLKQFDDFYQAE
jgi:hypothetical protein